MSFTILSHAGIQVRSGGFELLIDPWLIGSCYWRSWWNYPPVQPELVSSLRPDAIYLTHVHWDHFHGPSLAKFPKDTPILVPRGHYARMRQDLEALGFKRVRELRHGERLELAPGLAITSFQFFPFLDSGLVIEDQGTVMFDANDAKFMGLPLQEVLTRFPAIDFVFRSHSSANGRLCFDVIDAPGTPVDDETAYIRSFAAFVRATGAKYAVPCASNHCFLHDDVIGLNHTVRTPFEVLAHFEREGITRPKLQVLVTGEGWSAEAGFRTDPASSRWFGERDARIAAYRAQVQGTLDRFAAEEAAAELREDQVAAWCAAFSAALPLALRVWFRGWPVRLFARNGAGERCFELDIWAGTAREVSDPTSRRDPLDIHTTALILKQCIQRRLFSHLPISKRVRFVVSQRSKPRMHLLHLLWEAMDYDWLPLDRLDRERVLETLLLRWREVVLYGQLVADVAAGRGLDQVKYLRSVAPPR